MPKIWLLPAVPLRDRASLPKIPAIYYAVSQGKVLYVGKADNLYLRWNSRRFGKHHKLEALERYPSVQLRYWQRPLWRLGHDEALEIKRLKPLLNKRGESTVWWISAIDWLNDSLKIGCAIVLAYIVFRLTVG